MPKLDISGLGIRVVLDRRYYNEPRKNQPLDVEGTALRIQPGSYTAERMMKEGRILDLVCDPRWSGITEVYIRWDNDERMWFPGGNFLLRRAKVGFCVNIWDSQNGIKVDKRPFKNLLPHTYSKPTLYDLGASKWTTFTVNQAKNKNDAVYGSVVQIPYDGRWHSCIHQGVLCRSRKIEQGFEWHEDHVDEVHFLSEDEAAEAVETPTTTYVNYANDVVDVAMPEGELVIGNTTNEVTIDIPDAPAPHESLWTTPPADLDPLPTPEPVPYKEWKKKQSAKYKKDRLYKYYGGIIRDGLEIKGKKPAKTTARTTATNTTKLRSIADVQPLDDDIGF